MRLKFPIISNTRTHLIYICTQSIYYYRSINFIRPSKIPPIDSWDGKIVVYKLTELTKPGSFDDLSIADRSMRTYIYIYIYSEMVGTKM